MIHPPLSGLAFRRIFWPTALLSVAAILWALWTNYTSTVSPLSEFTRTVGVERYTIWMAGLLVGGPMLIGRTASFAHKLVNSETDWCASRAASRLRIIASAWSGAVLAATAWASLIALAAELGSSATERTPLQPAAPAHLSPLTSDQEGVVIFDVQAPTDDDVTTLRIPVGLIATGGPSATLKTQFTRSQTGELIEEELLIATRRPLEAQLPPGAGALRLELERVGDGAHVLISGERAEWWKPASSALMTSLMLWLIVCMISAAMLAAALGLGTWMRPTAAGSLLLAASIALWFSDGALGGWGDVMEQIANGDGLAAPSLRDQGGALITTLIGVSFACASMRRRIGA